MCNDITDAVRNLLMKVQHVTVSANVTEPAAWLEVTFP